VKKVLLIQPPAFYFASTYNINPNPPLGLCYIAAELLKHGYDVRIVDVLIEAWNKPRLHDFSTYKDLDVRGINGLIGLPDEEVIAIIDEFQPDIVGVSNLFTVQRANAHHMCMLAKQSKSKPITVMGGKHPTALPNLVLQDRNVDFVIRGEGEKSFLQLIRALEAGASNEELKKVDGLALRDRGMIFINPKTDFVEDLNELAMPARHLLPMERYFNVGMVHGVEVGRYMSVITSRGCPAECTFCSAHESMGYDFRQRSVENVLAELDHVAKEYGVNEILFEDDNLTLNPKRAKELFRALKDRPYKLKWNTPNGIMAQTLDPEVITAMAESGCQHINLAIESGVQRVVDKVIRKPLKLERVPGLVKQIRDAGMTAGMFLVVGNPGESLEEIRESFRFLRKVGPDTFHVAVAMPLPGTELLEICQKEGHLVEGFNWDFLRIDLFSLHTKDWTTEELQRAYHQEMLLLRLSVSLHHPKLFISDITSPRKWLVLVRAVGVIIADAVKRLIFGRKYAQAPAPAPVPAAAHLTAVANPASGSVVAHDAQADVEYVHFDDEHRWRKRAARKRAAEAEAAS